VFSSFLLPVLPLDVVEVRAVVGRGAWRLRSAYRSFLKLKFALDLVFIFTCLHSIFVHLPRLRTTVDSASYLH